MVSSSIAWIEISHHYGFVAVSYMTDRTHILVKQLFFMIWWNLSWQCTHFFASTFLMLVGVAWEVWDMYMYMLYVYFLTLNTWSWLKICSTEKYTHTHMHLKHPSNNLAPFITDDQEVKFIESALRKLFMHVQSMCCASHCYVYSTLTVAMCQGFGMSSVLLFDMTGCQGTCLTSCSVWRGQYEHRHIKDPSHTWKNVPGEGGRYVFTLSTGVKGRNDLTKEYNGNKSLSFFPQHNLIKLLIKLKAHKGRLNGFHSTGDSGSSSLWSWI